MEGGGFTAKRLRVGGLESSKSGGLAVPPDLQIDLGCPWIEKSRCTATSMWQPCNGNSGVLARPGPGQHDGKRICMRSSGLCLTGLSLQLSNTSATTSILCWFW